MRTDRNSSGAAPHNPRAAVYLATLSMAASALFAALVHSGVHLTGATLPVVEVAFFRSLFALVAILPVLWMYRPPLPWRPHSLRRQILRGAFISVSVFFWFYGLATVPLVEAVSLSFTAALFVTIGAALFLGERVGAQRWGAVIVGFAGALVILRPGFAEISIGMLSTLLGSVLWAAGLLMTKRLSREDGNLSFVLFTAGCTTVLFAVPTAISWVTPPGWLLAILAAMGLCTALGHWLMSNALRLADASLSMPIDYLRLVWVGLIGYFFFGEQPDILAWFGAAMIIGASLFVTYRESRRDP